MWRMRTARYPLRLSSPFREIQGGSTQAGEPGVLRDSEAWGRLSQKMVQSKSAKGRCAARLGGTENGLTAPCDP